jgi:hypothetical protein
VIGWSGPDGEPTLGDVEREFPGWRAFRGTNGLSYATLKAPGPLVTVRGEDPRDLRDSIVREVYRRAELEFQRTGTWPEPACGVPGGAEPERSALRSEQGELNVAG